MTTQAMAEVYEVARLCEWEGRDWASYNPHEKPIADLPVIYGFNNGGAAGWMSAVLIAEDGTPLGGHVCSSEGYMPHDLGIVDGARLDRHEGFREHYPDGYRMEFVPSSELSGHAAINLAFERNKAAQPKEGL